MRPAAVLLEDRWEGRAGALLEGTRSLVARQAAGFAFDWLLSAASLRQAYGDHARAFTSYEQALGLRPRDPLALLGQATALEFSAIPDGFGGVVVADRDVWRLLQARGEPPAELSFLLASPKAESPHRRELLEHPDPFVSAGPRPRPVSGRGPPAPGAGPGRARATGRGGGGAPRGLRFRHRPLPRQGRAAVPGPLRDVAGAEPGGW